MLRGPVQQPLLQVKEERNGGGVIDFQHVFHHAFATGICSSSGSCSHLFPLSPQCVTAVIGHKCRGEAVTGLRVAAGIDTSAVDVYRDRD
jgi:hypothetical protein